MARSLRIEFPGALYHVTSRGNRREDIYLDKGDRLIWMDTLDSVCTRMNWVCHAYCQMTNHYHIVVETPEGNLSLGMRQFNSRYAQWFNRRHGRVGHVFQGRYKSILVEKDPYLLEVSRYVVLNPVRAGAVRDVAEWGWSSYRAMVGETEAPAWLSTDWLLSQFAPKRVEAVRAYVDFVQSGLEQPGPWRHLKNEIFLGSLSFVREMQNLQEQGGDLSEIPRAQRRAEPKSLESFRQQYPHRKEAMAQAYLSGGYLLKEIAYHFGVHYSTVSRAIRRYGKPMT